MDHTPRPPGAPQTPPAPGGFPVEPAPFSPYASSYPAPAMYPPPFVPPPFAPPPKKRRRLLQTVLLAVAVTLLVIVGLLLISTLFLLGKIGGLTTPAYYHSNPPNNSFSVIQVVGELSNYGSDALGIYDPSYHHSDTLAHVKSLAENDGNKGILLYMNTPGGGVYESDELYLALMDYKEETGRPVWAYMADTCASGGYYVCAAADTITANRNTITGSIGVYIALTDTSALYEMLGIETVLVKSGDNKGAGMSGVPVTNEQRAVYQSIVDEEYDVFVDIVAEGRSLSLEEVRTLADGRIYTGRQALANGLVDKLGDWESLVETFETETGAKAYYPNFSRTTELGSMLGSFVSTLPQNETQTQLNMAEKYPTGVPMALYDPTRAA